MSRFNQIDIVVEAERLSDDSVAYNVRMKQGVDSITFACADKSSAISLMARLQGDIMQKSLEDVTVEMNVIDKG